MLNQDDFINRLQTIMDYYSVNASYLADYIGVPRSSISHILSQRNKPSLDLILKITEKFTFQIAPQVGFLVTPPDIWSETPIFNGKKTIEKTAFSSFYFALAFGGKYSFSEKYFIDLHYTTSLTNVFNKDNEALQNINIGEPNYFRHSYISVGVGYIF